MMRPLNIPVLLYAQRPSNLSQFKIPCAHESFSKNLARMSIFLSLLPHYVVEHKQSLYSMGETHGFSNFSIRFPHDRLPETQFISPVISFL